MSERFGPSEPEVTNQQLESRFGDEEETLASLTEGEVRLVGSIDEQFPDIINTHRNVVDLAEVDLSGKRIALHKNANQAVEISYHGHNLLAIFKPYDGEDEKFKFGEFNHQFYPREYAAYLISRHFGFDIVPPTTIREVNGRVGSLQQFLAPPSYLPGNKALESPSEAELDSVLANPDLMKMQLFDHILGNADRNRDNFLIKMNQDNRIATGEQGQLIAIDHGVTLDDRYYQMAAKFEAVKGPYIFLTYDNETQQPVTSKIPDELRVLLEEGLDHRDLLSNDLAKIDGLEPEEIQLMWQRATQLVEKGIFVSPLNAEII